MNGLVIRDLQVTFGSVAAVDRVSLDVPSGRLVGLIGPNGAGKTTFIDAVSGFVPAIGTVALDGRPISGLAAHRRARLGLGRTWQALELFDELTVGEHIEVAMQTSGLRNLAQELLRPNRVRVSTAAQDMLSSLSLAYLADRLPRELSHGERKLVDLARALAARPRVLCLDEPAAGLNSDESCALGDRLRNLIDEGLTVLLVDHDMGLVLGVCDEVYVMEFGRIIAGGAPDEVQTDPRVIAAYLGGRSESVPA